MGNTQLIEEGWLRHQQEVAKPRAPQTGWSLTVECFGMRFKDSPRWTIPSAPSKVASPHFLMSRPPLLVELVEEGSSPS